MFKFSFLFSFIGLISFSSRCQTSIFSRDTTIEAKIWSKDSLKQVKYSNWKPFATGKLDWIAKYVPVSGYTHCKYGGNAFFKYTSTGFFHTAKINNRWFVIDPEGHTFYVTAVNSIRPGTSTNNDKALQKQFGSTAGWATATFQQLQKLGFNTAGSWSDGETIKQFNLSTDHPIAYCPQLNLLSGYVREASKKNPSRKNTSVLAFIMDDDFETYCNKKAEVLTESKNDPNVLGYFSDNEIAFTYTEINALLKAENTGSASAEQLFQWMKEKGVDEKTITRAQKEEFIGMLTAHYYKTVSAAIKKFDPNHLYIGSRLHSSAKNNSYIFKAAEPYIDIISINYYGDWEPRDQYLKDWKAWSNKPFFITEFYTKGEDAGMANSSGAGWIVKTQTDRGLHYQNFCIKLLQNTQCVGWHWFRYQDNDPSDTSADQSNQDSNKGLVNTEYKPYENLTQLMLQLHSNIYSLTSFFDKK
jgi:hypothetical protein